MVACDGFNMSGTKTYFCLSLHMCSPGEVINKEKCPNCNFLFWWIFSIKPTCFNHYEHNGHVNHRGNILIFL